MSSLIIKGDTSGAITLSAPNAAGDSTYTLPAVNGSVMVSGNMPAFSASPSSNQTISHNTTTKILLQTEQYDTNNNFASSTFTPTVAGYYNVMGQVRVDYASSKQIVAAVFIYKNGSSYFRFESSFVSGTGGSFTLPINQIIPMNGSTDTMEMYYYFYDYTSSASYSAQASETRFQGVLVRAA